jgi:predicted transcriptional regulator
MRLLRLNRNGVASSLGPLEADVMDVLWQAKAPLSVAEVRSKLRPQGDSLSYSTIKAVLNNLSEKGHVAKCSAGKSNVFAAAKTRSEFESQVVSTVLKSLLRSYREPVIAHFVDALNADKKMLDQLERMIEQKQGRRRKQ